MDSTEEAKLEAALDLIREARVSMIQYAKSIALDIAKDRGYVTAPMVMDAVRHSKVWGPRVADVDPRFMGAVFRDNPNFEAAGWTDNGGSHGRPVRIWELRSNTQ